MLASKKAQEYNLTDKLDILVNNGGVSMRQEFVNTDFAVCEKLINTNTNSHIALTKGFLPMLKQSKGKIVNISSIAGIFGAPLRTVYSASKFAIAGFSKALRPELHPFGI
mmetsp:Transcript_42148/g.30322  ORF Transcript_42148/g.30322 Transcript_42148/m.30322 type:complete len:110 (-) Transcript_42148:340-669(-)